MSNITYITDLAEIQSSVSVSVCVCVVEFD